MSLCSASLFWTHISHIKKASRFPCKRKAFWESVVCRCDMGPTLALTSPHGRVHSAPYLQLSAGAVPLLVSCTFLVLVHWKPVRLWLPHLFSLPWCKTMLSSAGFPGRRSFQRQPFPTFNIPSINLFHLEEDNVVFNLVFTRSRWATLGKPVTRIPYL